MSLVADPIDLEAAPRADSRADPETRSRDRRISRYASLAARTLGVMGVLATTAVLALLDYPIVFGRWEGFTTFPVMAGPAPELTFQINPGGFIYANDQSRYALVDLGYYTAEWLGWSLFAFRLPALAAGAASVLLFLVVAGRAFGFWPAIVGALALALNPMFLVYWHQLIVTALTMLFLMLLIERYQHLERGRRRRWSLIWLLPLFALAFVLVLLHYGPGRAYGGALIGFWAVSVVWQAVQDRRAGRRLDRTSLLALPAFGLLVIVIAILLDQRNSRYLASPFDLLVVEQSELVKSTSHLTFVLDNLPVMVTAIIRPLNLAPEWFGEHSSDVLVDFRYHLVPISMLPLFLLGLGVAVAQVRRSAGARLTLVLLAIMCAGPVFSSGTSISEVRMIFTLVPLYLCVAAGTAWLLARRRPILRYGAAGLLVAVLGAQVLTLRTEVERHRTFVDELAVRWSQGATPRSFASPIEARERVPGDRYSNGSYRYYVDEGGVPALSLAQRIKLNVPGPREPNEVVLISLDGAVQRGDDTGSTQLVFFLRELGLPAALYDTTMQRMRGAGSTRPGYVVADNSRAAAAARRLLESEGRTVVMKEIRPPR